MSTGPSVWAVDLITVLAGERERYRRLLDQPILAAKGRTLIDGKGTRELTERLESRWYIELLNNNQRQ